VRTGCTWGANSAHALRMGAPGCHVATPPRACRSLVALPFGLNCLPLFLFCRALMRPRPCCCPAPRRAAPRRPAPPPCPHYSLKALTAHSGEGDEDALDGHRVRLRQEQLAARTFAWSASGSTLPPMPHPSDGGCDVQGGSICGARAHSVSRLCVASVCRCFASVSRLCVVASRLCRRCVSVWLRLRRFFVCGRGTPRAPTCLSGVRGQQPK
jgi:hypothetical protein